MCSYDFMFLPQVSTWFANARRRLKKENKVTWSPRACKSSDDRGCDDDSDDAEKPLKIDKDLPGKQDLNQSVSTFSMFQDLLKVGISMHRLCAMCFIHYCRSTVCRRAE